LVDAFLALDVFPKEWDNVLEINFAFQPPTKEESESILLPWRPQHLRELAAAIWTPDPDDKTVWVRTHYDKLKESDQKFREWIKEPGDVVKFVLDDASCFDFGDEWQRVLTILPEIAGPFSTEYYQELGLCLVPSSDLVEGVEKERVILRRNLAKTTTPAEEYLTYDEGATSLQTLAVDSYLLVADKEAFETNLIRVIWLDSKGNVVRNSRLPIENIWEVSSEYRERWRLSESAWFLGDEPIGETNLGEKYLLNGEIGRDLYGVKSAES
jgi:hypothetical protein